MLPEVAGSFEQHMCQGTIHLLVDGYSLTASVRHLPFAPTGNGIHHKSLIGTFMVTLFASLVVIGPSFFLWLKLPCTSRLWRGYSTLVTTLTRPTIRMFDFRSRRVKFTSRVNGIQPCGNCISFTIVVVVSESELFQSSIGRDAKYEKKKRQAIAVCKPSH